MPNDGVCATQQSGQDFDYVDQLIKDYPSFSQVKQSNFSKLLNFQKAIPFLDKTCLYKIKIEVKIKKGKF